MHRVISIIIVCLCFAVHVLAAETTTNQSTKKQDSLWSVWKDVSKSDTDRLGAIGEFCWNGYLFSQPDSAFYFAQLEYDFAIKANQLDYVAKALNIQGVSYWIRANYDSALFYYKKALAVRYKINDRIGESALLNNIALVAQVKGDYQNAIKYNYQSLKIKEALGDKYGVASTTINLGAIYNEIGDLDKAYSFFMRALSDSRKLNDKQMESNILNNIGCVLYDRKNYLQSTSYHQQSLAIRKQIVDKEGIALSCLNLGQIYSDKEQYDSAQYYLSNSLTISEEIEDLNGIAFANSYIGVLYAKQGNYKKAIQYASKALTIAKEMNIVLVIKEASQTLYKCYKQINAYPKAIEMMELYESIRDSIVNDKNHKQLILHQLQYEFDKKEEIIKKENEIKDLKLKRRYYIIVALLIFTVLSFIIYSLVIRQNKLVAARKNIELEQKLLGSQMNTHFTFNAINSIQEYILNNQNEEAHHYLSEFSKLMRMILSNNRKKMITINAEIELLKMYILFEEQRLKDKIDFIVENKQSLDLNNIIMPSMLLQPIIENSIWHGLRFQEGKKQIQLIISKEENDKVKIEIVDNGMGLSNNLKVKEYTSHGANIVKDRVRLLYTNEPKFDYFQIKNNANNVGVITTLLIPILHEYE